MSEVTKEQEILMIMRKVLTSIIKDTATPPGMRHPLSQNTVEDMRACLLLIATRERELAEARGVQIEHPFFADERPNTEVVSVASIQHSKKNG